MDFDELKVIWNAQTERRMYALDRDALHATVQRRGRRIERGANHIELGMIAISIVVAVVLASEPLLHDTDHHQYISAAVLLTVAANPIVGRRRRREEMQSFETSLVGDLDRALSQVDYHVRRVRTFQWWFLAPAYLTIALSFALEFETKSPWALPLCIAGAVLAIFLVRLELRCVHLPRKRNLEALRAKLLGEG